MKNDSTPRFEPKQTKKTIKFEQVILMKKFMISFALALCMALTLVPIRANAADATGNCGPDVYYNYKESTGELIISGSGCNV